MKSYTNHMGLIGYIVSNITSKVHNINDISHTVEDKGNYINVNILSENGEVIDECVYYPTIQSIHEKLNLSEDVNGIIQNNEIGKKIKRFLMLYAKRDASDETQFNSPDADWLNYVADCLLDNNTNFSYNGSSWIHGGYKISLEGGILHDEILEDIKKIKKNLRFNFNF